MIDGHVDYYTYFIGVRPLMNIGCSQCGDCAVQVLVCETDKGIEVVESQCELHSSVE